MSEKNVFKYLGLVGELGLIVSICIGGGLLLGVWLDEKLGTRALFTILLIFAGAGAAFIKIYRMVLPRSPKKDNNDKNDK